MLYAVYRWIVSRDNLRILIIATIFLLFCTGVFFLFYAYVAEMSHQPSLNLLRGMGVQVVAFALGVIGMLLISRVRHQIYRRFILLISIVSGGIMFLLFTPLAIERNGAVRWVDLGIAQFQPSEIMKIGFIFLFAFLFTHPDIRSNAKKLIGYTLGSFAVLALASWAQPDYGTMLILLFAIAGMAIIARLPAQWWLTILLCVTIGIAGILTVPSYISERVDTFYAIHFGELTQQQRHGSAYQPLQNLRAVRSGGATGQGLGFTARSRQTDIPELTTDSIFAVVALETGFVGAVFVILIFLFFFALCYTVARFARDPFGKYIVVGITTMFASQFFVNILVVLALPATGIPLIFFSRGGTSIILTLAAVGIILGVLRQQPVRRVSLRERPVETGTLL